MTMAEMHIVWWDHLIPSLAVWATAVERREESLTPLNICVTGNPGTAKTQALLAILKLLHTRRGLRKKRGIGFVDASTLDDFSELAGVVNIGGNVNREVNEIIPGDLLDKFYLFLDELMNMRRHLEPQMRNVLQGRMTINGKEIEMKTRAIVATGNLTVDMGGYGEAEPLKEPMADRFALVCEAPSMQEMNPEARIAVIEGQPYGNFNEKLLNAVAGIEAKYSDVEEKMGRAATLYVVDLLSNLVDDKEHSAAFLFEPRRGILLRQFVLGALALCEAEPESYNKYDTVYALVRDCLSFRKLSMAEKLDDAPLRNAHYAAFQVFENFTVDHLISWENDLDQKIKLIIKYSKKVSDLTMIVSDVTKAEVARQVRASDNDIMKIACQVLVQSDVFKSQSKLVREKWSEIHPHLLHEPLHLEAAEWLSFNAMSPAQQYLFELACKDPGEIARLENQLQGYLDLWGVSDPTIWKTPEGVDESTVDESVAAQ
jgi:MoxR-like ATPase